MAPVLFTSNINKRERTPFSQGFFLHINETGPFPCPNALHSVLLRLHSMATIRKILLLPRGRRSRGSGKRYSSGVCRWAVFLTRGDEIGHYVRVNRRLISFFNCSGRTGLSSRRSALIQDCCSAEVEAKDKPVADFTLVSMMTGVSG